MLWNSFPLGDFFPVGKRADASNRPWIQHVILHAGDHVRKDFVLEVGAIGEVISSLKEARGRYSSNRRKSRM